MWDKYNESARITIPATEYYENNKIHNTPEYKIVFRYSMRAVRIYENMTGKLLIGAKDIDTSSLFYAMSYGELPLAVASRLSEQTAREIMAVALADFSFHRKVENGKRSAVKSVLEMYAGMVVGQIPFEAEDWHITRVTELMEYISRINNGNKAELTDDEAYRMAMKQRKQMEEKNARNNKRYHKEMAINKSTKVTDKGR